MGFSGSGPGETYTDKHRGDPKEKRSDAGNQLVQPPIHGSSVECHGQGLHHPRDARIF